MQLDDTVCFCFHVTYRKLCNYAKHHKPPVASMMTECLGAGTGCGWCRPIIIKIWEKNGQLDEMASEADRKAQRQKYWLDKYGKKPPADKGGDPETPDAPTTQAPTMPPGPTPPLS